MGFIENDNLHTHEITLKRRKISLTRFYYDTKYKNKIQIEKYINKPPNAICIYTLKTDIGKNELPVIKYTFLAIIPYYNIISQYIYIYII